VPTTETIICDPAVFIQNRVELGLDDLGLQIKGEGADWGDSDHELFLVRQALGEIPADRHPPNRTATIPLIVRKEGAVNLAQAAAKLQRKIGLWQREGGFVQRTLDGGSGSFTTHVATQVHGASIAGLQGWLMAHKGVAQDVTLTLTTDPYFYAIQEIESELFKAENVNHLKWEIANIKGSAPGLVRVSIKNEGANDWKGLLAAMESRDLASVATRGTTADVAYECENLTLAGGSTVVEPAETSNGKAVKNAALTAGYISILSSKTLASGHMTHTGSRRIWMRVKDLAGTPNVELKLVWRNLSAAKWSENKAVKVPVRNGWCKVDLGEVIAEAAVLGEQRWEWRLMAKASQGTGTVELDITYILPTEQMLAISTPPVALQPDSVSTKNGEVLESVAGGGTAWTNPGNAKLSDNVYATAEPAGVGGETNGLLLKKFGFAIPAEAIITGIVVEIERKAGAAGFGQDTLVEIGKLGGPFGKDNKAKGDQWPEVDAVAIYGGSTDTWGGTFAPADVNAEAFYVLLKARNFGAKVLLSVDQIKMTVYYSTVTDENRVCFATRSMELRGDGIFRQHPTDNVWGRGVPDGFLPFAPPSGIEGRAVRGIIVPSRGDHLTQADLGNHKISARVYHFPGYHFVSEL
jgi:hypothetical protein